MRGTGGHTGLWPPYRRGNRHDWQVGLLQGRTITTEHYIPIRVKTWADVCRVVEGMNLYLICDRLADLPQTIPDKKIQGTAGRRWVRLLGRDKQHRFLVEAGIWGGQADMGLVQAIRDTWDHCGAGSFRTPGKLGECLLFESWRGKRRISLPNGTCARDLKLHGSMYQRVEGDVRHEVKIDIPSAYPSHFVKVPAGTSCRLWWWVPDWVEVWFAECRVTITEPLELGIFPVRGESGRVYWPTEPGEYVTWLWGEVAADLEAKGGTWELLQGWGWSYTLDDTTAWSNQMQELRETAPGGRDSRVGKILKAVANHTIGAMGIGRWFTVEECDDLAPGEAYVMDSDGPTNRIQRRRSGRGTMIHWQRFCVMQVSRTIYRLGLPWAQLGCLEAIRTDAYYLRV